MAGRVKVRPIAVTDSASGEIEVRWASSSTDTGSRFDVRYRVDQRKWKTWKNDTRALPRRLRPQRQAGQLQAQPPHLQDQGALGAPEGHEAQRLVPGSLNRCEAADAGRRSAEVRLSGPCEVCGRRPAAAAGRPRAAPSAAGRCGRRAGGPRRGPPGPGYGRRAATRSRG